MILRLHTAALCACRQTSGRTPALVLVQSGMGRHLFPQKTRAPRCSRMEPGPSGVPHAHGTRVKRAASRPSVSLFDSLGVYRPDKPNASASSRNDFRFASKSCVMVTTINSVVLYRSLICRIRSFTCSLVPTIIRLRFS